MNPDTLHALLSLAACLAAGSLLGALHLWSLRWSTARLADGSRLGTVFALMAVRFCLLGLALALVARQGALPLLAAALGVLGARAIALRREQGP